LVGGVIRAGYELNIPLRAIPARVHGGSQAKRFSWLTVEPENIIVEAVKQAEVGQAVVVRLYESAHRGTRATLRFDGPVQSVAAVDLMEENPHMLAVTGGKVVFDMAPLEIKTLLVERTG
jgi:alpha-mannosidase